VNVLPFVCTCFECAAFELHSLKSHDVGTICMCIYTYIYIYVYIYIYIHTYVYISLLQDCYCDCNDCTDETGGAAAVNARTAPGCTASTISSDVTTGGDDCVMCVLCAGTEATYWMQMWVRSGEAQRPLFTPKFREV